MIIGKVIKMEKSNAVYGSEGEVVLSCFDGNS